MKTTLRYVLPLTIFLFLLPNRSPAPIVYREGEGIVPSAAQDFEINKNAQEQSDLAQRYEEDHEFARAGGFYRLLGRRFPRADIAATAQFNSGRMYQHQGKLDAAFNEYQGLVEKYPRSNEFEPALEAEYNIAKAYLDGKRVDIYGVPTLPSIPKPQKISLNTLPNAPSSKTPPS